MIYLDFFIKLISSVLVIFGLWLILRPFVQPGLIQATRKGKRLLRIQQKQTFESEKKLFRHLSTLIESTRGRFSWQVSHFVMLTLIIFFMTFTLLILSLSDIVIVFLISFFFSLIPYIFLRIRLNHIRVQTSHALLGLIPSLLQYYQAEQKDIYFALQRLKEETKDQKHMNLIFDRLLNDMQMNRNKELLKRRIDVFVYAIGGNFAKRIGKLILKSYTEHADILSALIQIEKDARKALQVMEHQKTQGWDTILLGYSTLVTFPGSLLLGYSASGPMDYWHFQFKTPIGLTMFVACIFFIVVSLIISIIHRRPKADL